MCCNAKTNPLDWERIKESFKIHLKGSPAPHLCRREVKIYHEDTFFSLAVFSPTFHHALHPPHPCSYSLMYEPLKIQPLPLGRPLPLCFSVADGHYVWQQGHWVTSTWGRGLLLSAGVWKSVIWPLAHRHIYLFMLFVCPTVCSVFAFCAQVNMFALFSYTFLLASSNKWVNCAANMHLFIECLCIKRICTTISQVEKEGNGL